jgi:lysophospholipase L1-like esterase
MVGRRCDAKRRSAKLGPVKISFLGDSLTAGYPGVSFLARLGPLLPGDMLLNLGRPGDTMPSLLERLRATPMDRVDLSFLWIGANDAWLGSYDLPAIDDGAGDAGTVPVRAPGDRRPPHSLRVVYEALLDLALDAAPLIVCVPPILPDPFEDGGVTRRVADIGGMIAAAVAGRPDRLVLLDLAVAFAVAGSGFTIDGVHLNRHGANVVAAAFAGAIERLRPGTA